MTYEDFKTYLITFLWKTGDTVLADNLDSLITMAHSALNRDLKIQERETALSFEITANDMPLPTDFHSIRSVASPSVSGGGGEWFYRTPAEVVQERVRTLSNTLSHIYSVSSSTIMFSGPFSADDPYTVMLYYQKKVPDYKVDGASWLADQFLDLYTYAVLKHSSMFLREDERIQAWSLLYSEALESCLTDDAYEHARGINDDIGLPYQASTSKRGGHFRRSLR